MNDCPRQNPAYRWSNFINTIMKIKDLLEAPIASFQTIGDFEKPGSMPAADRKLLSSPKAVKKIHDIFSKTPYDFNLFFINYPGEKGNLKTTQSKLGIKYGEVNLSKLQQINPELYHEIAKVKGNSISLIYIWNFDQKDLKNQHPLTAWIIAHRFAHALQFDKEQDTETRKIQDEVSNKFNEILKKAYNKTATFGWSDSFDNRNIDLLMSVLTMKSARDKRLNSTFEFFPETFAQYLLTGRVKFNPLPQEGFIGGEQQYQVLNSEIQKLSVEINQAYESMLKKCVGKVYTF